MINDATPETEAERHRRTVVGLSCRCPMCAPSVVADAGAGTLTICGEQYERDADGLWWYTRERLPYSTGARWGDVLDEVARLTSERDAATRRAEAATDLLAEYAPEEAPESYDARGYACCRDCGGFTAGDGFAHRDGCRYLRTRAALAASRAGTAEDQA